MATFLAVSWIVTKIDANVFRILPGQLNPQTYLGFAVPGLGLIISIIVLFLLGVIASNFIGKSLIKSAENLLGRVPVVSSVYNSLKQIGEKRQHSNFGHDARRGREDDYFRWYGVRTCRRRFRARG